MPAIRSKVIPDNVLRLMDKKDRKRLGKAGVTLEEATQSVIRSMERDLHRDIIGVLTHRGIEIGHARMDRKSTFTEGWPDFTFCYHGQPCLVEAKVGKNDLDPAQLELWTKLIRNGWRCQVVRTAGEFIQFLDCVSSGE